MFTTIEAVKELTGKDVTGELLYQAQAIIESFLGKSEVDFTEPGDLVALGRACAYQAAYMLTNYDSVFEQIAVRSIIQSDGTIILDEGLASPFIAPLAMFSMRRLTGRNTRSVKTGSVMGRPKAESDWSTC